MSELLRHLDEVILPILESQPAPQLGEWNWPEIARHLRELTDKARREREALREALRRIAAKAEKWPQNWPAVSDQLCGIENEARAALKGAGDE